MAYRLFVRLSGRWLLFVAMVAIGGGTMTQQPSQAQVLEWTRQLGTAAWDQSFGASADGLGNVYISGLTTGNLEGENAGQFDAFVSKYDAAGTMLWTRQLGTDSYEDCLAVSADGLGNVYISGTTAGNLGGVNAGNFDAFVSKYDAAGVLLWTRQLGTDDYDYGIGISADGLGNIYISGTTRGRLGEASLERLTE